MKGKLAAAFALAAAAIAGIVTFAAMRAVPVEQPVAEIRLNGEVIRSIPLTAEEEFTVDCGSGWNRVRVSGGSICVTDADCPDRVCVSTGEISGGTVPIICLPHRLEIVIVSGAEPEFDADV